MSALFDLARALADAAPVLALQGAVACVVALVVERFGRPSPGVRLGLWTAAGLAFVVPVAPLLARAGLRAPPALHAAISRAVGDAAGGAPAVGEPVGPAGPVVALVALAVAGVLSAAGAVRGRRFLARARAARVSVPAGFPAALERAAARAGLAHPPEAVVTRLGAVPAVAGMRRPVLLWPAGTAFAADRVDPALLHECVHLARRDLLAATLYRVLRALWWMHPLAHVAARRAEAAREAACDADAARRLGDPAAYRRALLAAAARLHGIAPGAASAAWARSPAEILARLAALERPARVRPVRAAFAAMVGLLVGAAAAGGVADRGDGVPAALRRARAEVARLAADPDRVGCFELRFAVMRLAALEAGATPP